ncbi:serine/threonine-protein kinase [Streptomyces griseoloalbus]|uniref:non-specific serine/threonine protein kinase n=1 Tax=Streptomyces griseoloalbus TaxID=67303 RepID=A0A7W8BT73_9ACTN|nr:serine/threonine-protein kinase [Streptomyces albaduncus]MBB5127678.1 serine/threonine protein kinase [Streptomyces albaduncus]GGW62031.1 serine/threonine protein kinase [Streptomyces albaduncus]
MGEVFAGRYELVDPIGRGGVGAVWRAWDHRRRRYVAAKVLLQSDAHSLLRFVREQALRIDHPHVLAPTSWAADDDKVLFTMDLVAGGSLVHLVGDYGPLPPAFVCTLLDQLLAGLAAVHAEDVVHRDVKPANVLLEATGTGRPRLRLSDFGIAMRMGEPRLTETNLVVGTPGYLAPEQMMGSEPDFPADLFAVGLVALYLLEGAKPDAKALIQYFADHGTPGAPQGIPEPLWQVVATLLQPDPQARFRTATGARKALAAAAELLPAPGPDDELIEIFDQLGPLPPGFAADGPLKRASGVRPGGVGTATGEHRPQDVRGPLTEAGQTGSRGADAVPGTAGGHDAVPVTGGRGTGAANASADMSGGWGRGGDGGVGPTDPRQSTASSTPPSGSSPQPPGMSDTGSFHLPPPQATITSSPVPAPPTPAHAPRTPEQGRHVAQHQPANAAPYVSPHEPTHPLRSPLPRPPAYRDASTAEYTARAAQVPVPVEATSRHGSSRHGSTHRPHRRRSRRPGPPATVAVPVLLLALACYAVGFWALTRI